MRMMKTREGVRDAKMLLRDLSVDMMDVPTHLVVLQ